MAIVRIEHPVRSYESWKKAFDADPVDRKGSGVRRWRVYRAVDDPLYVMIDLELGTREQAEAMLSKLKALWARVDGKVISDTRARIVEVAESGEL